MREDDRYFDAEGYAITIGGDRYGPVSPLRDLLETVLRLLAQVDRSPEGQDNADWPDRNDESAVAKRCAQTTVCGNLSATPSQHEED